MTERMRQALERLDHNADDFDDRVLTEAPCGYPDDHVAADNCPWCDPHCDRCGEPWRRDHRCRTTRERVDPLTIRRYQEMTS